MLFRVISTTSLKVVTPLNLFSGAVYSKICTCEQPFMFKYYFLLLWLSRCVKWSKYSVVKTPVWLLVRRQATKIAEI